MDMKTGSALVVGAGIAGIRAALDLAETGHKVILIDKAQSSGGLLAMLDYQFPNDHCGMCKMLPLVDRDASSQYCLRRGLFHENIDLMLATELVAMEGEAGSFRARLRQKPPLVDPERCIGCGECSRVCPVEAPDSFNAGLTMRKAVYLPVPHNIPNHYVVDTAACTHCGECEKVCPTGAIDLRLEARRKFHILVVDDELVVRDSIKEWLQDAGFSVDTAESGEEALGKLRERPFQLMLLDVKMPGLSGIEVLRQAIDMQPLLPVVMMTAFATVETAVEAMKLGAREYLVKPFDPEGMISSTVRLYDEFEREGEVQVEVGALILTAGVDFQDPSTANSAYGYSVLPDVVTSIEFERMLSGVGPSNGRLVRPSDGKRIQKIAWLQCVGSRSLKINADYCSSVCCMFSIKEAVLAKEKSEGPLDAAIFYMDMRTFGKDFQRYRDRAETEHGVRFVRSRVHTVELDSASRGLMLSYTDFSGAIQREAFDLVVLAVGQKPIQEMELFAEITGIELNSSGFCWEKSFFPGRTNRTGIVSGGSFTGLRDISESLILAGSASAAAARLVKSKDGSRTAPESDHSSMRDVSREPPCVSVVLCTCGGTLANALESKSLGARLDRMGGVGEIHRIERLCTREGWGQLEETLRSGRFNRLLIGACIPCTYGRKLRELAAMTGLDPVLIDSVDIRSSWFSSRDGEKDQAVRDVRSILAMGIERLRSMEPSTRVLVPVEQKALIVGGGIAGMTAALTIADQGFDVHLVERSGELGGNLRSLHYTIDGESPTELLEATVGSVEKHPRIHIHRNASVKSSRGRLGRFQTTIENKEGVGEVLLHGVTVLATGGREAATQSYCYGESRAVVTLLELESRLRDGALDPNDLKTAVMIQCVDSREEPRNYCSRICCISALKNALHLKELNPQTDVFIFYRDIMAYGFYESYYTKARRQGVVFLPYHKDEKPRVRIGEDGRPVVSARDPLLGRELSIDADLLVLSTGIVPEDNRNLVELFGVEMNPDGFYQEAESKWRPVDFIKEGIFMCGIAHSPKTIGESAASAEAAAQRALRILSREALAASRTVASVRHAFCSLCRQCVDACPYGARWYDDEDERIVVDPITCQGCGSCASVCPNSAAVVHGYRDGQVFSIIDAALE